MDTIDDPARHAIGGNQPPEPTPVEKASALAYGDVALRDQADERVATANRWITERPVIADAETADKAEGFKAQIRHTLKALDEERRSRKKPIEEILKGIDDSYRSTVDLLNKALTAITERTTAWLQAEEARLAREKAAAEAEARRQREEAVAAQRLADEAARQVGADALRAQQAAEVAARRAAEAEKLAAKAPEKAAIKGDFTTRAVGIRSNWTAVVTDEKAALKHYGKNPTVRKAALDAALKLAQAEAKAAKSADAAPPGFRYFDAARQAA